MSNSRVYHINEEDCVVWTIPNYLTPIEQESLHIEITELPLIQHYLGKMYGRDTWQKRLSICLGQEYCYSGKTHPAIPWEQSPIAWSFCNRINTEFGTDFNSGLVNYYRNGEDYISAHSDAEDTLATNGSVYGLSTNCERDMIMRWYIPGTHKPDPTRKRIVIPLPPGSLLGMEGKTQEKLSHEIPVRKRAADRGSVTYRKFK